MQDPAEVDPTPWGGDAVMAAAAGCYHSAVLTQPQASASDAGPAVPSSAAPRRVFTFGLNNYGQLAREGIAATGAQVPRSPGFDSYNSGTPAEVEMPAGVAADTVKGIGAAFYNTFVLLAGSGVLCSGSNAAGQCGSAAGTHSGLRPVPELAGQMLKRVAGGYCHTLALTESGRLFTLGCGEDGQRGDARELDAEAEFSATLVNEVVLPDRQGIGAIAAGANHSLAVTADGTRLWGWGSNDTGQLGPGVDENVSSPVPVAIDLGPGAGGGGRRDRIVSVSAGYAHTAVLTERGRVITFGRGENGQLGTKVAEDSPMPATVRVPTQPCKLG